MSWRPLYWLLTLYCIDGLLTFVEIFAFVRFLIEERILFFYLSISPMSIVQCTTAHTGPVLFEGVPDVTVEVIVTPEQETSAV